MDAKDQAAVAKSLEGIRADDAGADHESEIRPGLRSADEGPAPNQGRELVVAVVNDQDAKDAARRRVQAGYVQSAMAFAADQFKIASLAVPPRLEDEFHAMMAQLLPKLELHFPFLLDLEESPWAIVGAFVLPYGLGIMLELHVHREIAKAKKAQEDGKTIEGQAVAAAVAPASTSAGDDTASGFGKVSG
jgi:hypothetical protein